MKIERRIAKVEQKKNKPVVTRDLFGREHIYPVEQKYKICKRCNAKFKIKKVGLISKIAYSTVGAITFWPLGIFFGPIAQSLADDQVFCENCNYSSPD